MKNFSILLIALFAVSCSSNLSKSSKHETPKVLQEAVADKSEKEVIYFDTDSFKLTEKALKALNNDVLPMVKNSETRSVIIEGHCDERGSVAYNKRLGKNRAGAVKTYLVKNGVKSSMIRTVSYGKSKPVDSGHDEDAWEKNRRAVTISIR